MPGNEVGDRVHNFFDQDLSQSQHHSQVVDGNWPVLSNNLWVGNQREIGAPLISNSKSINVQHSALADSERGHASQSSRVPHGLNFTQSTLRPEFSKSQSPSLQSNLNGYMHGHQVFQTRQNEANFLGVDTEPDRHNVTSRGLFILESQQGNGPEHHKKGPMRLEATESPVNFDFLGGQQQMSGQQPGMLQSLPRQQSGFGDIQLLQQQAMLKQMQEQQRQQQLQQQEVRQQNSINRISSIAKHAASNHSPALINGTPIHDYAWQPELMAGNASWLQRGASPVMQGSSNGLMLSPEQGQALRIMGLVPQQVDQSLYGFPISSTRGTSSQYSHNQMDKPTMQQLAASGNSFPGNQYAVFPDQVSMQDGTLVSRPGFQGKNLFGHVPGQGLNSGVVLENSQVNAQQRNAAAQEFRGRQEPGGPSETLQDKTAMQVTPSQSAVPLDPTEEKILFGSDDNIWDAFGKSTSTVTGGYNPLDGTDFPNAFPTMQSGSWSALMQSAVAETSSGDVGLPEEWSGLTFPNSDPPTGNHQPSTFSDSGKQQTVWADNNSQNVTSLSTRSFPLSDDMNMSANYCGVQGFQQSGLKLSSEKSDRFQSNSSHRSIQQSSEEGSKWSGCSPLQKPLGEGSQIYGNATHSSDAELNVKSISGSWTHQHNISSYNSGGQPCNKPNGLNFMESVSPSGNAALKISENANSLQLSQSNEHKRAMHEEMDHGAPAWKPDSVPNSTVELERVKSAIGSLRVNREDSNQNNVSAVPHSSTSKGNQETSQQLPNSHQLDYWKRVDSPMNSKGGEGFGKYQHHLNKAPQVLESSANTSDKGAVEMHEIDNCDKKDNSGDSYRSNLSHHASTGGLGENVWLDVESRSLPGAKQKSSAQIGRKSSGSRKFQYHPMGNLDEDVEPYYGPKHVAHSQAMTQQGSRGLKSHDPGYFGQSKFVGHIPKSSMEMEKGRVPDSQGDTKGLDEVPSRGSLPGYAPSMSAPFDRSAGIYASNKAAHSSQNMLELLHKVDQSREHGTATHLSSSDRNPLSEMPEGETSDGSVGHLQQNQSSASQGFGLQLAPPSQRLPIQNHALSSQSSSQTGNSFSSSLFTPEIGDKSHTWLAPTASVQSLPFRETSQGEFRNNKAGIPGQTVNEASQYNVQGNFSVPFTSGFPYTRGQLQNQHMTGVSGQVTANQSVNMSFDRLARFKHIDDSRDRAQMSQSPPASLPDKAGSTPRNNLTSPANISQPSSIDQSHHVRIPTQQIPVLEDAVPVSEPPVTSGIAQRGSFSTMLPNAWTNISTQQRLLGVQPRKASSSLFDSHLQSNSNLGTTPSVPQKGDDQDAQKGGDSASEPGACSVNTQGFVSGEEQLVKDSPWQQVSSENIDLAQNAMSAQGKGSIVKHHSDASVLNTAATQRDIEAFGRSLKPDNNLHRNYSLLHQVQAMKSPETDPSNRGLKRFKGPDCSPDTQQLAPRVGQHISYGFNAVVRDASVNRAPVPSGDAKMLSFSSEPGDNRDRNAFAQLGNISSQDKLAFGRNDSQNDRSGNNTVSVRSEHPQISPLMAPSWFDQYGTFKNGQILPMYDSQKNATLKTLEQPFIIGKSSDSLHTHGRMEQVNAAADTNQYGDVLQSSTSTSIATEHFSSHLLPPAVTDQTLVVVRPKKRKSATSELLSWHKEVTQGSQRLQNISIAEVDWAQVANRLVEKVEDEAEMIEDWPSMLRPRRRLILSTQLMQQLLRPPPASVLSADAISNYESVAYFVARLALGDACSLISCLGSDSPVPLDSGNLPSEKPKTSERIGEQYFSKVMEDFIGRARQLESDYLRLDKSASILDLRVECQDLEKFSVINRFAKFHGRGQADGAETSSSSDATANAQKTCPQRYVTALPMPRNLPDRVQCLSL